MEEAIQINKKELQENINRATTIANQVCTTVLEPYCEASSHSLEMKLLNDHINKFQPMNSNKNEEKIRKN